MIYPFEFEYQISDQYLYCFNINNPGLNPPYLQALSPPSSSLHLHLSFSSLIPIEDHNFFRLGWLDLSSGVLFPSVLIGVAYSLFLTKKVQKVPNFLSLLHLMELDFRHPSRALEDSPISPCIPLAIMSNSLNSLLQNNSHASLPLVLSLLAAHFKFQNLLCL